MKVRTLKDVPPFERGMSYDLWLSKLPASAFRMTPEELEKEKQKAEPIRPQFGDRKK